MNGRATRRTPGRPGLLARTLGSAIGVYQRLVSPLLSPRCRFAPSCSEYSRQSIARFGAGYGSWLMIRRLARCQPFCAGGLDPVPEHRHSPRDAVVGSAPPGTTTTTGATR